MGLLLLLLLLMLRWWWLSCPGRQIRGPVIRIEAVWIVGRHVAERDKEIRTPSPHTLPQPSLLISAPCCINCWMSLTCTDSNERGPWPAAAVGAAGVAGAVAEPRPGQWLPTLHQGTLSSVTWALLNAVPQMTVVLVPSAVAVVGAAVVGVVVLHSTVALDPG